MPLIARDFEAYQRCSCTQSRSSSSSRQRRISSALSPCTRSLIVPTLLLDELEPEEVTGAERQQVGQLADPGKARVAEQLDGMAPLVGAQIELDCLRCTSD